MKRPSVSVIVITLNEERNLPRALESVRWADEIVVVDSGSTDATEAIARRYTDRFHVRDWEGYGKQKQRALDLARGDWVLVLDADEEVTPELHAEVRRAVAEPGGHVVFEVSRQTRFGGAWLGRRGWRRERKRRLIRRGRARFYERPIHEGVAVSGPIGRLEAPLLHHSWDDIAHRIDKMNRYTGISAAVDHAAGKRSGVPMAALRGGAAFGKAYLLHGGFLYRGVGFVHASLEGWAAYLKHVKRWEIEQADHVEEVVGRGRTDPGA